MDIVPPPVVVPPVPARQWWTWALFGCLAAFVVVTTLYSIFKPDPGADDSIQSEKMTAEVVLKQYVTLSELSKDPQLAQLKRTASGSLESSEVAFRDKMLELEKPIEREKLEIVGTSAKALKEAEERAQKNYEKRVQDRAEASEEAASWVLALQTIQQKELDSRALDKLQLSADDRRSELGLAYEGELTNATSIEGIAIPELVARWKVENPTAEEFPADKLNIDANPGLFFGYLGWMVFVFFGGIIACVTYWGMKASGLAPAKGYQEGMTLAGFDARGGRMSIYFATFLLISLGAGIIAEVNKSVDMVALNAGVFLILICLTPFFATVPLLGDRVKWGQIIGDRTQLWKKIAWGFGGYMANFPLAMGATLIVSPLAQYLPPPSHELIEMLSGSGPISALLLFFMAAVAAPLIEEPMFRGVLFPALQRVMKSPTAAIVLSGTIFAVIHPQGPLLWPALACIGMTAAVLTRQTGSLIPAILMHFLHNATIYGLNVVIR